MAANPNKLDVVRVRHRVASAVTERLWERIHPTQAGADEMRRWISRYVDHVLLMRTVPPALRDKRKRSKLPPPVVIRTRTGMEQRIEWTDPEAPVFKALLLVGTILDSGLEIGQRVEDIVAACQSTIEAAELAV